jgi:hypothetical protein
VTACHAVAACPLSQVVDAASSNADVLLKLGVPSAGTHVLTVQPGEMIEIVIQNDRAGFAGGEYASNSTLTSARNGREQHSFHLHGYHFWQVGLCAGFCRGKFAVVHLDFSYIRQAQGCMAPESAASATVDRAQRDEVGTWVCCVMACPAGWHRHG